MAISQDYFSNGMPVHRVNRLKLLLIIILVAIMGLDFSTLFIHIIRLHFTFPKNPWIGYLSIFFIEYPLTSFVCIVVINASSFGYPQFFLGYLTFQDMESSNDRLIRIAQRYNEIYGSR